MVPNDTNNTMTLTNENTLNYHKYKNVIAISLVNRKNYPIEIKSNLDV